MLSFVISAPRSGSGKTTVSLGLMRALTRTGHRVQPFKCGPDYIDTMFHHIATGRHSINLDLFMSSKAHVVNLFNDYLSDAEISIIEGAMGMFDGYDNIQGSCADIARILNLPVILIIDATATAYSVAAMIYGFTHFRPEVSVAGVIFNRVASQRHYSFLQRACNDAGVECFGYITRNDTLHNPSRHLGLSLGAATEMDSFIEAAADAVSETVDINRLLDKTEITHATNHNRLKRKQFSPTGHTSPTLKIAVAHDDAFNFIYPANIMALQSHPRYNIDVTYFSPLTNSIMPTADILYLPGGYPELYAEKLSRNTSMRNSIKEFAENDGKILAECGGMIYLSRDIDNNPMCGVIPIETTMKGAKLTLGYRHIELPELTLKGHEFHYSRIANVTGLKSVAKQFKADSSPVDTAIYRYKNCYAGYTHLYWAESDILKLWDL